MTENDRIGRILWAVIAVLLVGGLVAVPLVGDGDDGDDVRAGGGPVSAAADASSTTVAAVVGDGLIAPPAEAPGPTDPAAAGPSGAPAGGGTGARGGGPSSGPSPTTAASSPAASDGPAPTSPPSTAPAEDLGTPTDPGPAKPPRAGTYRYKTTAGSESRDSTTAIEDRGTSGTETRQLVKTRGEGFDIDSEVAWRPDGVHVLSSVIMFGSSKGTCDWQPDTVQLKLPAAKGTTWESASTCSMTGIGPTPIPVSRKVTGTFVELRRVRVAGQVVDVWAIDGTERIEAAGRVTERSGTSLFSPKHGFAVSSSGTITTPDGPVEYRTEVQNLDPE